MFILNYAEQICIVIGMNSEPSNRRIYAVTTQIASRFLTCSCYYYLSFYQIYA